MILVRRQSRLFLLLPGMFCCALLVTAGCSSGDKGPKAYPVSGEFYVKGQPAAGARLTLQPEVVSDPKLWPMGYPYAVVQPDGTFKFCYYADGDGAPEGKYKLLARWEEGDGVPNEDPAAPPPKQKLDPSYNDPTKTPWSVVVEAKPNQLTRYEVP